MTRVEISRLLETLPEVWRARLGLMLEARLQANREANDSVKSNADHLRGRIAEVKLLLDAVRDENPPPEAFG